MAKAKNSQAFDQLSQDARIKGASRLVPDAAKPEEVSRELAAAVMRNMRAYQEHARLHVNEIARMTGIWTSTLKLLWSGSLPKNFGQLIIDLDRWLEQEIKREQTPKPTEFVMTRVAEQVYTVAEVASSLKGIGLVYGWAGIGKTMALQAIAAERPGTIFISVKTATATPLGLLQALAAASEVRDVVDGQRLITHRLDRLLKGTGRLIIVDEIHKLCGMKDDKSLHILRDLHDATGVPMLWSGTTDLVAYLDRAGQKSGREPLAQIRSRICVARDLTDTGASTPGGDGGGGRLLYSVEEIRRAFARNKMRLAPDAANYLMRLANLPESGALRTCKTLVIIATKINADRADVLTADMLRAAHQLLVSRRDFTTLDNNLREMEAARPVARVG